MKYDETGSNLIDKTYKFFRVRFIDPGKNYRFSGLSLLF